MGELLKKWVLAAGLAAGGIEGYKIDKKVDEIHAIETSPESQQETYRFVKALAEQLSDTPVNERTALLEKYNDRILQALNSYEGLSQKSLKKRMKGQLEEIAHAVECAADDAQRYLGRRSPVLEKLVVQLRDQLDLRKPDEIEIAGYRFKRGD